LLGGSANNLRITTVASAIAVSGMRRIRNHNCFATRLYARGVQIPELPIDPNRSEDRNEPGCAKQRQHTKA
jgi:hypothetical protein